MALCVTETGPKRRDTFVLDPRQRRTRSGQKVQPGFLKVLSARRPGDPAAPTGAKTSGRRTALANWLATPENPLTARVMVNRLWQHHFGRGIVATAERLRHSRATADAPGAARLAGASSSSARGWQLKAMHRLIMTAHAYRMASTPGASRSDGPPTPMTCLAVRHAPADGRGVARLDPRRERHAEPEDRTAPASTRRSPRRCWRASRSRQGVGHSGPDDHARRSVYVHVKRSLRCRSSQSFDAAEPDRSCPVRFVTMQPTQALGTINSEFLNDEAEKLAHRLRARPATTCTSR